MPLPPPAIGGGRGLLAFRRILLQLAEELLEILPGAEVAAFAGHHHDLDVVVDLEPRQRVIHLVVERGRHGVALLGAIERGPGDAVVHPDLHEIVFVFSHRLFLQIVVTRPDTRRGDVLKQALAVEEHSA